MARVRIPLPDRWHFQTEITVRVGDINFGGHLAHDALLTLLHEARALFFRAHGWTELDVEGIGIILADAAIMYLAEAFHGDSLLIDISARDFTSRGCDLLYRVTRREDGQEVARAKTGLVFFDYAKRQTVNVPAVFLNIFAD